MLLTNNLTTKTPKGSKFYFINLLFNSDITDIEKLVDIKFFDQELALSQKHEKTGIC